MPSWLDMGTGANMSTDPSMASNWGAWNGLGATGTVNTGMPIASGGFFGNGQNLGFNAPTAQMALSGLQTLAGLWGGLQGLKMAKKQFAWTKDMGEQNLANQMKSYNTALADRARSRGVMESQSQAQVDQYVQDNSLTRRNGG
jgi:hypothetical protein